MAHEITMTMAKQRIMDENARARLARRVFAERPIDRAFRLHGSTLVFRVADVYRLLGGTVPCVWGKSDDGRQTRARIADTSLID